MDVFNKIIAISNWLRIVLYPLTAALITGYLIYRWKPNDIGLSLAIIVVVIGLIAGIKWAKYTNKKRMGRAIPEDEFARETGIEND